MGKSPQSSPSPHPDDELPEVAYTMRSQLINGEYKKQAFYPRQDQWPLKSISGRAKPFNFTAVRELMTDELVAHLKRCMIKYLQDYALDTADTAFYLLVGVLKKAKTKDRIHVIEADHLAAAKSMAQISSIRSLFNAWKDNKIPGLTLEALDEINDRPIPKEYDPRKHVYDPQTGALSEVEFQLLKNGVHSLFANDEISLDDYCFVLISLAFGLRPSQIALLRCSDLHTKTTEEGKTRHIINISLIKQRGEEEAGIRQQERTLDEQFAALLEELRQRRIQENKGREQGLIPLLDASNKNACALMKKVAKKLAKDGNDPMPLCNSRPRHSVGTKGAEAGLSKLALAKLMTHKTTGSVQVYIDGRPDTLDLINEALNDTLEPLADAFLGKIVKDASETERGNDPSSHISSPDTGGDVGVCEKLGMCLKKPPEGCYICDMFRALESADHEGLLLQLINKRKADLTAAQDDSERARGRLQYAINDDAIIRAIAYVVKVVKERRKQLNG